VKRTLRIATVDGSVGRERSQVRRKNRSCKTLASVADTQHLRDARLKLSITNLNQAGRASHGARTGLLLAMVHAAIVGERVPRKHIASRERFTRVDYA